MTPPDLADRTAARRAGHQPAAREDHAGRRPPGHPPRRPRTPTGGGRRPPVRGRRTTGGAPDPTPRLRALLVGTIVVLLALTARLVDVQAYDSERYVAAGQSQRVRTITLAADRGSIFDREGRDLALSVPQRTIWANPRLVEDPMAAATALAPVLQLDAGDLRDRLTRDAGFVYLARKVPDDVAEAVERLRLPGVFFIDERRRFFPAGDLARPVLGAVGLDNDGLAGLELQHEERLAGRPGRIVVERDPKGGEIPGGLRRGEPSVRGDDLVLTIDRSLQFELERALAARVATHTAAGGMAVVMEVETGEILAMASFEADAGQNPRPPVSNWPLTRVYEPGSVNKLITVAGALEEGLYRPSDRLQVPDQLRVGNHTFKDHAPHPIASWDLTDILRESSNVGSIMIGQRLGKDRLDHYLRAFGFGEKTALRFPGEPRGLLLDPGKWYSTSIGTVPIGNGLAVTATQMLAAYNSIANGGEYVAPKLVRATVDAQGRANPTPPSATRRVVSERTAAELKKMLVAVVDAGTGTNAAIEGYTVAGKTGTARKPLEGRRGYEQGAYLSSFAGFVPAETPKLSAIVVLDEPTPIFGGLVAAPVFADVMGYALREFRIPPAGVATGQVVTPSPAAAAATSTTATPAKPAGPRAAPSGSARNATATGNLPRAVSTPSTTTKPPR